MSCPVLESQYSEWLHYKNGDTVKYINNTGNEIYFIVYTAEESPSSVHCSKSSYGCNCPDCPLPYVSAKAKTDDTSRQYVYQGTTYNSTALNTYITKRIRQVDTVAELQYQILNHSNLLKLSPVLTLNSGDSLLSNFTAGAINYSNVILHQIDTTVAWAFIWKSYYSKEYGIIAFYDRKTQSLFYRKP